MNYRTLTLVFVLPFFLSSVQAADPPTKVEPERLNLWNGNAPTGDGKFEKADARITVHKPEKPAGAAIVCVVVSVALADKFAPPRKEIPLKPLPFKDAVSALEKSKDRDELLQAARSLCRDKDPEAIPVLLRFLKDPGFLKRLDDDVDHARQDTRLQRIVEDLGAFTGAKAEESLLSLAEDKEYKGYSYAGNTGRFAIVAALACLEKPSDKAVAYCDRLVVPDRDSVEKNYVVKYLVKINNAQKYGVIDKLLTSPRFEPLVKTGWLDDIFPSRDDPRLLRVYEKLLASKVDDEEYRERIVQTLFDYPPDWVRLNRRIAGPKAWSEVSTESLREFLKLSEPALKFGVSDQTKEKVEGARKVIEAVLATRAAEKK